VRGSHPNDFHAHHDVGHVNFIVNGQAALIESSTSGYRNPRLKNDFQSVRGHNVLQVDEQLEITKNTDTPINVSRLDDHGGEVSINPAQAYPDIQSWQRDVKWTMDTLTVHDTIQTQDSKPHQLTLRYLLGSSQDVTITKVSTANGNDVYRITVPKGRQEFTGWPGEGKSYWNIPDKDILLTPAMVFEISSPMPITVTAIDHVNHTMRYRFQEMPCKALLIQSAQPVSQLDVTTQLVVTPNTDLP
jgi:hypothetical protein